MTMRLRVVLLLAIVFAGSRPVDAAEPHVLQAAQKSGTEATLMGIHFRSPHLGWAVGTGGVILKTTDGGRRWRPVTSGTTSQITSVFFADAQHGWVVGANGIIL